MSECVCVCVCVCVFSFSLCFCPASSVFELHSQTEVLSLERTQTFSDKAVIVLVPKQ